MALWSPAFYIVAVSVLNLILALAWWGIQKDADQYKEVDFGEAIYFAFITTTKVGYGDYHPTETGNILLVMLLILFMPVIPYFAFGQLFDWWHPAQVDEYNQKNRNQRAKYVLYAGMPVFAFVMAGILLSVEDKSMDLMYMEALSIIIETLSTIGYGDITPHATGARFICCFTALVGVSMLTFIVLLVISDRVILRQLKVKNREEGPYNSQCESKCFLNGLLWVPFAEYWFFMFIGSGIMRALNSSYWTYQDTIYMAIVSSTLTGYGDVYPYNIEAKIFNIFMILAYLYMHAQFIGLYFDLYHNFDNSAHQAKKNLIIKIWIVAGLLPYILVVGGIFYAMEIGGGDDITYLDGVYFMVVSLTGVGYGDVSPDTDGGKFLAVLTCWLSAAVYQQILVVSVSDRFLKNNERQQVLQKEELRENNSHSIGVSFDYNKREVDPPTYNYGNNPPAYQPPTNIAGTDGTGTQAPSAPTAINMDNVNKGSSPSLADEIKNLNDLRKQGVLSDEEFKIAKAKLLKK